MAVALFGLLNCGLPFPAAASRSQQPVIWGHEVTPPVGKQLFIDYGGIVPTLVVPQQLLQAAGFGDRLLWDRNDLCQEAVASVGIDLPGLCPAAGRTEPARMAVVRSDDLLTDITATWGFPAAVIEPGWVWPRGQPQEDTG